MNYLVTNEKRLWVPGRLRLNLKSLTGNLSFLCPGTHQEEHFGTELLEQLKDAAYTQKLATAADHPSDSS